MESSCGLVGHRTKKNLQLEATSRSIIINGTKALREKYGGSFKGFAQAAKRVRNLKVEWRKKQEEVAEVKLTKKQTKNLKIDGRVMKQLKELKRVGGPFTDVYSIDNYLADESLPMKERKSRMKMEIQYARDTSLSIPRNNPVFRIRKQKSARKKAQELSAFEFGENLKSLITKKNAAMGKEVTIEDFISTLDSM